MSTDEPVPRWFSAAIERVRSDIHALELKLVAVDTANSTRLDTGQKTFDAMRSSLAEVRAYVDRGITEAKAAADAAALEARPKSVSMKWLATFVLGAFVTGGTIIWGLATLVYDRPTKNEVKELTASQSATISSIQTEQAALRGQIQALAASTAAAAADVSAIRSALVPDAPGRRKAPK